jgi:hypothetical protein
MCVYRPCLEEVPQSLPIAGEDVEKGHVPEPPPAAPDAEERARRRARHRARVRKGCLRNLPAAVVTAIVSALVTAFLRVAAARAGQGSRRLSLGLSLNFAPRGLGLLEELVVHFLLL